MLDKEIEEIDKLYGDGWFSRVLDKNPDIAKLSPDQQIKTIREKSIHGQSGFNRDYRLIYFIKQKIFAKLHKNFSIASVGCSSGEEVFNILLSGWNKRRLLTIDAYDCNPEAIEKAKLASFEVDSRDCDYIKKFKPDEAYTETPHPRHYGYVQLKFTQEAKDCVNFSAHDIAQKPLDKKYNAIVLSNILCHYASYGRKVILENSYESLNDNGILLCESHYFGSANAEPKYDKFMKDLSRFGFEKRKTVVASGWGLNCDETGWTRVYKRV